MIRNKKARKFYCLANLFIKLLNLCQNSTLNNKGEKNMDKGQFLLYQTPDGESKIEVKLQDDTVWLSLDQMAELFQRNKSTISRHIKNVLEEGELLADSTIANFATVQNEGKRHVERQITYYNLDMIISVGYRVHSYRGVQFRIWATKVLKDYIVKGIPQRKSSMNVQMPKKISWDSPLGQVLCLQSQKPRLRRIISHKTRLNR